MEFVLWGISYANLCMLLATIPVAPESEEKTQREEEAIEADSPMALKTFLGL